MSSCCLIKSKPPSHSNLYLVTQRVVMNVDNVLTEFTSDYVQHTTKLFEIENNNLINKKNLKKSKKNRNTK